MPASRVRPHRVHRETVTQVIEIDTPDEVDVMSKQLVQGIIIGVSSALFGLVVYRLARRQSLSFRYAVGWLALLTVGALSSVLVPAARPLADFIGVTPGVIVSAAGVLTLLGICVQLSVSISGLQEQVRTLSEEIALHTARGGEHLTHG